MAILNRPPEDRAQLLVIAAVGIAILLALMALVLNAAVFGEVHVAQTGESLSQERGTLEYLTAVEQGVGGLLAPVSATSNTSGDLESELETEVDTWVELARPAYERDGIRTDAALTGVGFESTVVQDDEQAFRANNTLSNWTVVADTPEVREFELNVTTDGLATPDDDCTDANASCFALSVDDTWELFVYDNGTELAITVDNSSSDPEYCRTGETSVVINVTAGTFGADGTCSFRSFLEDDAVDPPYTLEYVNGENVTGTYEVVVEGPVTNDERFAKAGSPRLEMRIDRADVFVRYRSVRLSFETEIRVEPGENDG